MDREVADPSDRRSTDPDHYPRGPKGLFEGESVLPAHVHEERMSLDGPGETVISAGSDDQDLADLVRQLRSGECTPFLGAGASVPYLPLGAKLAEKWARRHGYPLEDSWDLPRVMQYVATQYERSPTKDVTRLKQEFRDEVFGGMRRPDFSRPDQIHGVLAGFPLGVYVTTNYDDFMLEALEQERLKTPRWEMSLWYGGALDGTSSRRSKSPSAHDPLVFHLHGHHSDPRSFVLTEDDYIEYLVKLAEERGRGKMARNAAMLPLEVGTALRDKPLLFVGYSLQDWTFRILFRTLLHDIPDYQRRRNVSVQLEPSNLPEDGSGRRYLEEYFEAQKITVFWEEATSFARRISDHLGGARGARSEQ